MLRREEEAVASPGSSRMMAGSEIPSGSSLMSSQLHTWGKNPIFLLFQLFTSSHGSVVPSSVLCSTLPRTALNSVEAEPSDISQVPVCRFFSRPHQGLGLHPCRGRHVDFPQVLFPSLTLGSPHGTPFTLFGSQEPCPQGVL